MELYWLTTPCKNENWFVVAKSKKQAEEFHECSEGFNSGYAKAKLVCGIPLALIEKYKISESDWPSHELLADLGGNVITTHNPRKVNFNGILYKEGSITESIFYEVFREMVGVYVIKVQNTNKYKIGNTKNIKQRVKKFATGNPDNIKIVFFIATEKNKKLENHLHKKFKGHRMSGEWFDFDSVGLSELENELILLIKKAPKEYKMYNLKTISSQAGEY